MKKKINLIILIIFLSGMLSGCKPKEKTPLVIFGAGSLIIPFDELEKAFEARYPDIDVLMEYHGSIQCIRHASELDEDIDLVASADYSLIPLIMYNTIDPETEEPYADWTMKFASNRMALAYMPDSLYADEINADNWYEILTRSDVKFGLSDPRFDANGYRTLMVFNLAEDYYGNNKIFSNEFHGQFSQPVRVIRGSGFDTIRVPEILEPLSDSGIYLRGSSVMLIALLESGDIDYAFEYESVVKQHGFEMVMLPEELNLGNEDYIQDYEKTRVNLDFRRFKSVEPIFDGGRIEYGLTIPKTSLHPDEAALFLEFLLSDEGRKIMEENYHPVFSPVSIDNPQNLPEELSEFLLTN